MIDFPQIGNAIAIDFIGVGVVASILLKEGDDFLGGKGRGSLPKTGHRTGKNWGRKGGAVGHGHTTRPIDDSAVAPHSHQVGLDASISRVAHAGKSAVVPFSVDSAHGEDVVCIAGKGDFFPSVLAFVAGSVEQKQTTTCGQ